VLLAETYQEMARWEEALECLVRFEPRRVADPDLEKLANILRIESNRHLDTYSVPDLARVALTLVETLPEGENPSVRARAAVVASCIASELKDDDMCEVVRTAIRGMEIERFNRWDRSKVLLAGAHAAYQVRHLEAGLSEVLAALRLLEEEGATDTTYVRVQTGVGAIACAQGRYTDGVAPLIQAYLAASRLDNFFLMCQAAHNASICLSHLGDPEEHRRWAILAREASEHLAPGTYERASAAAQFAVAHATLNAKESVEKALDWLEQEAKNARHRWVLQCIELYRADLNWLIGRKRTAFNSVAKAREIAKQALAIGFVGAYARWSTLFLMQDGKPEEAWVELQSAFKLLPRLDAKDRADVHCSAYTLDTQWQIPLPDVADLARQSLARIPVGCSEELSRMGLLLPH
jgi:tetratricopeptide (TPR) repeat protein